jgi:hypothetical protein
MTVHTPNDRLAAPRAYDDVDRGGGWVTFAGVLLVIAGTMNVIGGIAAIDDANFFVGNAQFMLSDLNTWGWVIAIIGAAQVLTAVGLFARSAFARWLGVTFAATNAFAQLMLLPAYPLWSLALFTLDILIIYGLISYGDRAGDRI